MTSNMAEPQEINLEDRISNLSGDVMECIMEFLPVRDAARTCVLSRKWRYVWADHPSLVLDMGFWDDIQRHKSPDKIDIDYANIVSSILLHHVRHIRKFVIDVSVVSSSNVASWLSSLCRRSLKVLDLKNSDRSNPYKVPSGVLLTSELTHLSLSTFCIKEAVGCFTNIQSLHLEDVDFQSIILTTPLLASLTIKTCFYDKYEFEISAPRLASLTLDMNDVLNLKPFFTCMHIDYAFLFSYGLPVQADGKHLVELLAFWPRISVLVVDGFCFEHLTATDCIPDNDLRLPLNLRRFALRDVIFDSEKIPWILYILKNSPLLQTFEIWFGREVMNDVIDEALMMEFKMDQLRTVKMKGFSASRNEVMFVKILLKRAPLLEKLLVEENEGVDPNIQIKILKELFMLQKKYPNTDIVFAPNLVPV